MESQMKMVKIGQEEWVKLQTIKANLQSQEGRSISFSEVIRRMEEVWGQNHDRQ
jgi:hypothetical protein